MAEFSNELPASVHIGACLPVKDIGAFCVQRYEEFAIHLTYQVIRVSIKVDKEKFG